MQEGRISGSWHIPPLEESLEDVVTGLGEWTTWVARVPSADGTGRLVGSVRGRVRPDDPTVWESGRLMVAADLQGRGLGRALLANLVQGVSQGYERTLELVGTGYRAEVKGNVVHLALGFSHPVAYQLPPAVTGKVAPDSKGSVLHLESPDKAALGQAAATIRGFRPPEPYGGKGVRYRGENILRKAGKAGKK